MHVKKIRGTLERYEQTNGDLRQNSQKHFMETKCGLTDANKYESAIDIQNETK